MQLTFVCPYSEHCEHFTLLPAIRSACLNETRRPAVEGRLTVRWQGTLATHMAHSIAITTLNDARLIAVRSLMSLLTTVVASKASCCRAVLGEVAFCERCQYNTHSQDVKRHTLIAFPALNILGVGWLLALVGTMSRFAARVN